MKVWEKFENIVQKGEIAHYEQLQLLTQSFQKPSVLEALKHVYKSH